MMRPTRRLRCSIEYSPHVRPDAVFLPRCESRGGLCSSHGQALFPEAPRSRQTHARSAHRPVLTFVQPPHIRTSRILLRPVFPWPAASPQRKTLSLSLLTHPPTLPSLPERDPADSPCSAGSPAQKLLFPLLFLSHALSDAASGCGPARSHDVPVRHGVASAAPAQGHEDRQGPARNLVRSRQRQQRVQVGSHAHDQRRLQVLRR